MPVSAPHRKGEANRGDDGALPVVAIGASAGGLKALLAFFSALPRQTGMAFVVLQHLQPTARSALPELLGKATALPVAEARDQMALEPDHVYTVPAGADAVVASGAIHLHRRDGEGAGTGPHLPIDALFTSLAHDGNRPIAGVVLSGTGVDGSQGLREIRGAGGIGLAQAPDSAEFDSMPQAAIAAGADMVLPPGEIAAALARMAAGKMEMERPADPAAGEAAEAAKPAAGSEGRPADEDVLGAILAAIRTATGQDFANYRTGTLWRRVQRRMLLGNQLRPAAYADFLRQHPAEARALGQDLLINVTSFFRDPEAFEALRRDVFGQFPRPRHAAGQELRLWVPACSSGEEVYSIAIALLEFLGRRSAVTIQIFGTDVDITALEQARAGLYSEAAMAPVSAERRKRFFAAENNGFRIGKTVRQLCLFSRHDICSDPPFSRLDLVSCRNLLIYFNAATQRRILTRLHYALRPHGFLLLGGSETTGSARELFSPVNTASKIYVKNAAAAAGSWTPELASARSMATMPAPAASHPEAALDQVLLEHYPGAAVLVNDRLEIVQSRGDTSAYLQLAPGKADLNVLRMARTELQTALRAALARARKENAAATEGGVRLRAADPRTVVHVEVLPVAQEGTGKGWVVLFHPEPAAPAGGRPGKPRAGAQAARLERELAEAQDALRTAQDQAQAANEQFQSIQEEMQSANEELQSSNEELETSKEEIQSSNEELTTLSDELRHRNEELTRLNDDLNNLLVAVEIPIVFVGNDFRIGRFTPTATRVLRIGARDLHRPVTDLQLNLDLPDFAALLAGAISQGVTTTREVRDLSGRWHRVTIRPYRLTDGNIAGAIASMQEIDALKRSEQSYKTASEFGRAIMQAVREPLLALNSSFEVQFVNQAFLRHFGGEEKELMDRPLGEIGGGDWSAPELRRMLDAVGRTGTPVYDWSLEQDFRGIGHRALLLNAERLARGQEQTPLILVAVEDITERRRAEEARLAIVTGRMAATMAHEINNPLSALANIVYVLKQMPLEAEAQELIRSADAQMNRVLHIARQTLGLYAPAKPIAVAVAPLLDEVLDGMAGRVGEQHITVERRYDDAGATVLAGEIEVRQIFTNLIDNAITAAGEGGNIILHVFRGTGGQSGSTIITVADNGPGIRREDRERCFEPFFSTKGSDGTGLGLWVARGAALKYGGAVRLRSSTSRQRHGTAFVVSLPADQAQA